MLKILSALAWLGAAVAAPGADAPATFKVGEFTFTRPAKWEWNDKVSALYKASLKLTDSAKGKFAEVKFVHDVPLLTVQLQSRADLVWDGLNKNKSEPRFSKDQTNVAGHHLNFFKKEPASGSSKPSAAGSHNPRLKIVYAFMESKEGTVMIMFSGWDELVDNSEKDFRKMIESAAAGK